MLMLAAVWQKLMGYSLMSPDFYRQLDHESRVQMLSFLKSMYLLTLKLVSIYSTSFL